MVVKPIKTWYRELFAWLLFAAMLFTLVFLGYRWLSGSEHNTNRNSGSGKVVPSEQAEIPSPFEVENKTLTAAITELQERIDSLQGAYDEAIVLWELDRENAEKRIQDKASLADEYGYSSRMAMLQKEQILSEYNDLSKIGEEITTENDSLKRTIDIAIGTIADLRSRIAELQTRRCGNPISVFQIDNNTRETFWIRIVPDRGSLKYQSISPRTSQILVDSGFEVEIEIRDESGLTKKYKFDTLVKCNSLPMVNDIGTIYVLQRDGRGNEFELVRKV